MHEQLKAKLSQLQSSLSQVDKLDDDSRELLAQVDQDIQRVLAGGQDAEGLNERLEQQAVAFEERHPAMSALLKDMMEVLAKMGI